jgi:hypothetical protein
MVEVQPISTEKKPERELAQGGVLTDEDIQSLEKDSLKMQKETNEYKLEKQSSIVNIRERLMRHRDKLFPLEIDIGEDEPLKLKVRRMKEKERAQFNKDNFVKITEFENMSAEEMDELAMRGYKLMAKLVVDPDWTVEEWMDATDTALLQHISQKVQIMTTEVSDAIIIEEFRKKSMTSLNFN